MSSKTKAHIVCPSKADAKRMLNQANEWNLDIPEPLTIWDILDGKHFGKRITGYLIDDADRILSYMCKDAPILAISLTKEE